MDEWKFGGRALGVDRSCVYNSYKRKTFSGENIFAAILFWDAGKEKTLKSTTHSKKWAVVGRRLKQVNNFALTTDSTDIDIRSIYPITKDISNK